LEEPRDDADAGRPPRLLRAPQVSPTVARRPLTAWPFHPSVRTGCLV
jgi:hypothetical protein